MVLDKLPLAGILLFCIIVGQVPTVLAVGAGGGCLNIFFSYVSVFSSFFLSGRRSDTDCKTVSKGR